MKIFKSEGDKLSREILRVYGADISYGGVMKLLRKKDVKLNGKRVGKDTDTAAGDEICVYDGFAVKTPRIKILFSCADLVAAYKPKGITSEEFYEKVKTAVDKNAIFTHRLDRNTDGIMIFALNERAYGELYNGFKNRTFEKYYTATVYGTPKPDKARITAYLKKDSVKSEVKISATPENGYEKIITEYEVLSSDGETSVLKVGLITGKTHQIRAHMAFIGHFIIGDGKYGDERINRKYKAKYQQLTATELIFHFAENSPLYYLNGKRIAQGDN